MDREINTANTIYKDNYHIIFSESNDAQKIKFNTDNNPKEQVSKVRKSYKKIKLNLKAIEGEIINELKEDFKEINNDVLKIKKEFEEFKNHFFRDVLSKNHSEKEDFIRLFAFVEKQNNLIQVLLNFFGFS